MQDRIESNSNSAHVQLLRQPLLTSLRSYFPAKLGIKGQSFIYILLIHGLGISFNFTPACLFTRHSRRFNSFLQSLIIFWHGYYKHILVAWPSRFKAITSRTESNVSSRHLRSDLRSSPKENKWSRWPKCYIWPWPLQARFNVHQHPCLCREKLRCWWTLSNRNTSKAAGVKPWLLPSMYLPSPLCVLDMISHADFFCCLVLFTLCTDYIAYWLIPSKQI